MSTGFKSLAAPLLIQLFKNREVKKQTNKQTQKNWEVSGTWPKSLGPCTHIGEPDFQARGLGSPLWQSVEWTSGQKVSHSAFLVKNMQILKILSTTYTKTQLLVGAGQHQGSAGMTLVYRKKSCRDRPTGCFRHPSYHYLPRLLRWLQRPEPSKAEGPFPNLLLSFQGRRLWGLTKSKLSPASSRWQAGTSSIGHHNRLRPTIWKHSFWVWTALLLVVCSGSAHTRELVGHSDWPPAFHRSQAYKAHFQHTQVS